MYQMVLWATDGSDGANQALTEARRLIALSGGRIVAAHCDQRLRGRPGAWSAFADEDDRTLLIERDVEALQEEGVPISYVTRRTRGEAADMMAELAAERDADVIVCGTRGLGALAGAFLGSFTQRLLHIAPCPVLAVPERVSLVRSLPEQKVEVPA